MAKIVTGITPTQFIAELNTRFSGVAGHTTLGSSAPLTEIDSNFANARTHYPSSLATSISNGLTGTQLLALLDANYTINAVNEGAYNDGSHSTETVAKINELLALQWTVYLPDGTYEIKKGLRLKGVANLIGESTDGVIIHETVDTIMVGPLDVYDTTIDVIIENVTLNGNHNFIEHVNWSLPEHADPQDGGVYFQAITSFEKIVVRNVKCNDFFGGGIQTKYFKESLIENCEVTNISFVAYTSVNKISTIRNCTSNQAKFFIESRGLDSTSILTIADCTATDLTNYGIRFYGNGSLYIYNVSMAGLATIDLTGVDDTNKPRQAFWLCMGAYYGSFGADYIQIKDFHVEHMNYGVNIEILNSGYVIDTLEIINLSSEDTLVGYWDAYSRDTWGLGIIKNLIIPSGL